MSKAQTQTRGEDYERFGRNLARLREEMGLSQYDISERLELSQSTYAGYETGTRKVPLSMIVKLSDFFKVKPDILIGIEESVSIPKEALELDEDEKVLLDTFRELNPKGRKKLLERAEELSELGYTKKKDISVTA